MLSGPYISPKSAQPAENLVILLHGYGSSGDDLIELGAGWAEAMPTTAFMAPHAPTPCDINPMGYQWFGLGDSSPFNMRAGLDRARPILKEFIQHQLSEHQLEPKNLTLVGFSQGTMLALDAMFALPAIKNIVGFSGAFYPSQKDTLPEPFPNILLVHGDADVLVPYAAMHEAERQLATFGVQAKTFTCAGLEHGINPEGLDEACKFILNQFTKSQSIFYMNQS